MKMKERLFGNFLREWSLLELQNIIEKKDSVKNWCSWLQVTSLLKGNLTHISQPTTCVKLAVKIRTQKEKVLKMCLDKIFSFPFKTHRVATGTSHWHQTLILKVHRQPSLHLPMGFMSHLNCLYPQLFFLLFLLLSYAQLAVSIITRN